MLGLSSPRLLTTGRVEVAYVAARKHTSQVPTTRSEGAAHQAHALRLDEARVVLLNRAVRLTPNGDALVTLTVMQFFLGGAVLFATALAIVVAATTDYDSILSVVGWPIAALAISFSSMVIALLVGLPLRLVPALRARWLAHGEWTVAGVIIGLASTIVIIAAAPMITVVDETGIYEARDITWWAQLGAWFLFAFSIAHFVWPLKWARRL